MLTPHRYQNMKRKTILLGIAVAAVASSCLNGSYSTEYTALCNFEYSEVETVYGKDSVFFEGDFYQSSTLGFYGKRSEDKETFKGGFMLTLLKDKTFAEGHVNFSESMKPVYSAAADSAGHQSNGCAIFYDSKTSMPEKDVQFLMPSSGTCSLTALWVTNTNYVVNAAKFGDTANGVRAFNSADDKLVLTVTAYRNGVKNGTATFTLLSYDERDGVKATVGWQSVDTKNITYFDELDFSLDCNVEGFPLYCCVDDLTVNVSISE